MRIGFFADMYTPHTSGVTSYIQTQKRQLEALGHEVFVLTYGNRSHRDAEKNVLRSPAIPWGRTGWQLGLGVSADVKRVARTLDIAHVQHPFVSGRVALDLCGSRGIPVVFTNHTRYDLYSDTYARFVPRDLRHGYLKRTLHAFLTRADLVIAPSEGIRAWLGDFIGYKDALVIPNSVETAPFIDPARPYRREDLGLPADSIVVAYVGRLGHEKRVDVLAEAFVRASLRAPALALLVIGDGPARAAMRRRIEQAGLTKRVVFAGMVPRERVPDHLAAADLFATASVSEVHPLVVIEALAAGLPVIAAHSPGISDTVTDGHDGLLSDRDDPKSLAALLCTAALDDRLRATMGEHAGATALRYDARDLAKTLEREYLRLTADGTTASAS